MVKDPVCGMTVNLGSAAASIRYKGQTYYFCSQMCKMMFEREPEKYVQSEAGTRSEQEILFSASE